MHGIQYRALRIINKEPSQCSCTLLNIKAKIPTVKERIVHLSHNYLKAAISKNNPLITNLNGNAIKRSGRTLSTIGTINNLGLL